MAELPPCGLYRTRRAVAGVPEGRLVYFHNHGDPGPGLYLPVRWEGNRARFDRRGRTIPAEVEIGPALLEKLPPEGLYRVAKSFHCCAKRCRHFDAESLVQLGYDGAAEPLLFVPEMQPSGTVAIPTRGTRIDREMLTRLSQLKVPVANRSVHVEREEPDPVLH